MQRKGERKENRVAGTGKPGADVRQERLAAALRENLKRRKAQARAKAAQPGEKGAPPDADGQKPAAKPTH